MKIICFSSHTAIWYFAMAEAVVASALQKSGHDVLFITPGDQFIEKSNLMQEKILREEFKLKGYEIGTVISDKEGREIDLIISKLTKDNFENLIIDNVNIGRIALYEFLLNRKKINLNFTQDEWKECIIHLKNTLISFFACKATINKENPDRILMFSALYSVNHVWEKYANMKGIPVYFIHDGTNLSDIENTLIIAKNNTLYYIDALIKIWSNVKKIPVSQKNASYVTDHFLELFEAKHSLVYSSPKSKQSINIKKIFNIKDGQKILIATMSSYDEMFAAEYIGVQSKVDNLIFASQAEWIEALINHVKERQNLFLIIRVHPREFPNKRDSVKSEHSKMLENNFRNLPDNIKINWPTDNVSIYDLAQEADVFLNAWSSVGVEMSLFGIPVVIYSDNLIRYPADLNYLAKDRDDYFEKIELALKDGWSYEKIRNTYRWLSLYYCRTIMRYRNKKENVGKQLDLKKTFAGLLFKFVFYFYNQLPFKVKHFIAKLLVKISKFKIEEELRENCRRQLTEEYVDISKVEKMLNDSADTLVDMNEILADAATEEEEDLAVRNELKRLYEAMYSNQSDALKIEINSLQHNLKRTIFDK